MKSRTQWVVIGLILAAISVQSADWPNYCGPDHNNISPEQGLLEEWPEDGPKELWDFPLGPGFGGPAIRDGKVYLLDRVENERDVFRCLDLETGEEIWKLPIEAPGKSGFNGSRTVPTVTEDYIFSVGLMGDFYCVDRKSRKLLWQKNIVSDFDGPKPNWGVSQTPFAYKDSVLVAVYGSEVRIIKCDQETGEITWKSEGLSPNPKTQYTSPVVRSIAGSDQVIMTAAGTKDGRSVGLSVETGEVLWSFNHWQCKIPIPEPTSLPGDRLFFTGGYGAGSAMVKIVKNEKDYAVEKIFQLGDNCGSQIHRAILYNDHLYLNSNSNKKRDGMTCLTLDGEILWQTGKNPNFGRGSLIMAEGMGYNLDGKTGELKLIEPDPPGYKEVSSFKAVDSKQMWAPLAISNGKLLARDQNEMKCFSISAAN